MFCFFFIQQTGSCGDLSAFTKRKSGQKQNTGAFLSLMTKRPHRTAFLQTEVTAVELTTWQLLICLCVRRCRWWIWTWSWSSQAWQLAQAELLIVESSMTAFSPLQKRPCSISARWFIVQNKTFAKKKNPSYSLCTTDKTNLNVCSYSLCFFSHYIIHPSKCYDVIHQQYRVSSCANSPVHLT